MIFRDSNCVLAQFANESLGCLISGAQNDFGDAYWADCRAYSRFLQQGDGHRYDTFTST